MAGTGGPVKPSQICSDAIAKELLRFRTAADNHLLSCGVIA
jgi:hypothetical protein